MLIIPLALILTRQLWLSMPGAWIYELTQSVRSKNSRYNLSHLILHSFERSGKPRKNHAAWMNFGYWQDTRDFTQACIALADLIANTAGLQPDTRVLDIGCGCADSLFHWKEKYKVKSATGINLPGEQSDYARHRLTDQENLYFIDDDIYNAMESLKNKFDSIVAIDCAYHFSNKSLFFQKIFSHLKNGGRCSMTDLCLTEENSSAGRRLLLFLICGIAGINYSELKQTDKYCSMLKDSGFINITVKKIEKDVLAGYSRFIVEYEKNLRTKIHPHKLKKFLWVGSLVNMIQKKNLLHYILISAQKP